MDLAMVATSILVGLLTGWLAGFVITGGGYGLVWNLILGLAGDGHARDGCRRVRRSGSCDCHPA
jgi:uncharacterized membrane protein YeaQ/YmgE (transglycosylase-associated protein family)